LNLRTKHIKRLVPVMLVGLLGLALVPATAQGDTVGDKQAEAARIEGEINANGRKADALSEQINGAQYRLDQAQAQISAADSRIQAAQAQSNRLEALLAKRAVQIYKGAGNATPLDAVDVQNISELSARQKYASAASSKDNTLVSQLTKAREDLATQKAQQQAVKDQAQSERDSLASAKHEVDAANATQQQLLGSVKGQIATLIAQKQAQESAASAARVAAAAQTRATTTGGGNNGGGRDSGSQDVGVSPGNFPAPSGAAGAAVAAAESKLGSPYVYAAAGPDTFDCSGLVMWAYAQAGVGLPHYSGAQYDATVHISRDALQPGDLIFYGSGGSDHVAMYVGGGTMIHAPHTGDVVRYAPIYGSPFGYGRVT
jgi:peptidoglycan DL-endopeptidase CwlO